LEQAALSASFWLVSRNPGSYYATQPIAYEAVCTTGRRKRPQEK
jgi:hypothetical protein